MLSCRVVSVSQSAANAMTYAGMSGYLAVITTSAENSAVQQWTREPPDLSRIPPLRFSVGTWWSLACRVAFPSPSHAPCRVLTARCRVWVARTELHNNIYFGSHDQNTEGTW